MRVADRSPTCRSRRGWTRPLRHALALAMLLLPVAAAMPARAALFGPDGLDPAFCRTPSVRQTVVYVDDMMMVEGQIDWARKLAVKLRATLSPGERVTVVRLSPANGQSSEIWSACWPAYTAAQQADIAGQSFLFSRNPLSGIGDQQKFFLGGMGAALTTIYQQAKRPADAVRIAAATAPHKDIIRALASDEGRFAASRVTVRAIIYSDMAENSDLGAVIRPPGAVPHADQGLGGLGERLGTWLRRSVFYAYGVGADIDGDRGFGEQARAFWTQALHGMAATLGGMGADLNVPNLLPVSAYDVPVTLVMDNQSLDGRLSLLTDQDGALVDSWLGISRLGSTGLDGSFRCEPGGACRLDATTTSGLATNAASEHVTLQGPAQGPLNGELGVRAQGMLFKLRSDPRS
ncbi:hypothetical protein [Lichenicoccus sp.]|uniref:hypothetical protein n=1 Tax=Lichenicoccus sp. TaxID=2781899 RepID=UPI003D0D05EA